MITRSTIEQPFDASASTVGNQLRIAFAMINCNRRDGSARAVNEVAERLADQHDVHLFARKAEDLSLSNITLHRIPGPGRPEVLDFGSYHFFANRLILSDAFDIVHSIGCNTLKANVVTIQNVQPAKKVFLDRLAAQERISAARRLTRWLYLWATCRAERLLYSARSGRRSPLFLPVSKGVERDLRKHYDIGEAEVRVIPNAADIARFKPLDDAARREWREQHRIEPDDFAFIFVGGEWTRKGLDLAVKALALISNAHVKLFVAGDDPSRARFEKLSSELGLGERVMFGGFQSDIAGALAACDAFLFPSWYEAFSLATLEAAACGLPIFATKINGAEDFIQAGINGDFLEPFPEQIAAVLQRGLADSARLRSMGQAARRIVEQSYTWDRIASDTLASYEAYLRN